jgi:hypothetical protein
MPDERVHRISDDLERKWLEEWAQAGIAALEAYLENHARFQGFLEASDFLEGPV